MVTPSFVLIMAASSWVNLVVESLALVIALVIASARAFWAGKVVAVFSLLPFQLWIVVLRAPALALMFEMSSAVVVPVHLSVTSAVAGTMKRRMVLSATILVACRDRMTNSRKG